MHRLSAHAARITADMRNQSVFMILGIAAELLCAASAAADDGNGKQGRDTGAWHVAVVDGGEPPRGAGRMPVVTADVRPASVSPVMTDELHVSNRAAWSLQLGAVRPPHVHRAYFGPSGGIPIAGDFNGDGLDELGMFVDGRWYVDLDGNGQWSSGDLWAKLGGPGDRPVVGDWDQDGKADIGVFTTDDAASYEAAIVEPGLAHPTNFNGAGFKNVGLRESGIADALLRTGQGGLRRQRISHVFRFGETADFPVVGDWQGTGVQSIGVFRDGLWKLDVDGDGRLSDSDLTVRLGAPGDRPVVGDFNRDGRDDLGVYRNGIWHIDTSGDRRLGDDDLRLNLGDGNDTPVVGDWDGDGRDQIGVVHRDAPGS